MRSISSSTTPSTSAPGDELLEHADHSLHRLQVGAQGLVGPGVLDLDGDLATVVPDRLVHLADAGRRDRGVVERAEPLAPLGAELLVEYPVDLRRGQRRRIFLQLRQRFAVGLAVLLGNRGFHHRQRLADLHRAALELTENGEQLLGGLVHQLGVDLVFRLPGQPLAQAQRRPAGHAHWQARELRIAGDTPAFDVCHLIIIPDRRQIAATTWQRAFSNSEPARAGSVGSPSSSGFSRARGDRFVDAAGVAADRPGR